MTSRINRRQMLTVAGLTLGAAWIEGGVLASPATAAPADPITLEPVLDRPVRVLSADGAAPAAAPRQLAVRIRNEGRELAAGVQLKVAFDDRLYAVLAAPVVTLGGRRVATTARTEPDPATGAQVCTITLAEAVPVRAESAGELIALLGTANPHLYPQDLISDPVEPVAAVPATPRNAAARRSLRAARPSNFGKAATPWGVEVGAGWSRATWGPDDRYWYYYPTVVSMTGAGPGRTAAAEFTVSVDPQVVTGIEVVSARLNNRPYATKKITEAAGITTDTVRQLRWHTRAKLDAGDQLDVRLRVTTRTPAGPLETITHPMVFTGMASNPAARQTGLLSVSRDDSSWA
ncbi:hypothetical protein [Actinoplanes sp. OR16]|uniref:hypothetical protein n=1 Tax=Actinoplanes sp. OR16 TaxID=946334 RepID=UPI000FD92267|nr:hypothetical protein [Actinoplanes sp. OR16]